MKHLMDKRPSNLLCLRNGFMKLENLSNIVKLVISVGHECLNFKHVLESQCELVSWDDQVCKIDRSIKAAKYNLDVNLI